MSLKVFAEVESIDRIYLEVFLERSCRYSLLVLIFLLEEDVRPSIWRVWALKAWRNFKIAGVVSGRMPILVGRQHGGPVEFRDYGFMETLGCTIT